MFQLKPLARTAIPAALEKAERYRLLNEPLDAESICRDVLDVEPDNEAALVTLVLALTDQFASGLTPRVQEAKGVAARLVGQYKKAYYSGIICERAATAQHCRAAPASGQIAYDLLRQAMAVKVVEEDEEEADEAVGEEAVGEEAAAEEAEMAKAEGE